MLGWSITISRIAEGGQRPAQANSEPGEQLATWQAGINGINWINLLLKKEDPSLLGGYAFSLGGNSALYRCTAIAKVLFPLIFPGGPNYSKNQREMDTFARSYGRGMLVLNEKAIDQCAESEWLLIEISDAS
jgi:hypothetical protein